MPTDEAALIKELNLLQQRRKAGSLKPEELQRLEMIQDVLLELGALVSSGEAAPVRNLRADAALEVAFSSAGEVVRAYSKNIGAGGLAVRTPRPLPVGHALELRIRLPDAPAPLVVNGTVVWAKEDTAGVAFNNLSPENERRIKELLVQDESVLRRIRSVLATDVRQVGQVLTTDVRELGRASSEPAQAQEVDTRGFVLVRLADAQLSAVTLELMEQAGFRTTTDPTVKPIIIVADAEHAGNVARAFVPLILVGVSGPDSLVGKMMSLKPAAFVGRPVSAAAICQKVTAVLKSR